MENKVIRVAQIIGKASEGGVEASVFNYFRNIDRDTIQYDFFVESTSKIINREKIESMGGHVIIIPSIKHIFKYEKFLYECFKREKYDIVHAHKSALNIFALRAAKKAGIPVRISHAHSTSNKKEPIRHLAKNFLKLFSKKYATHYFACGEVAGRWLFGNKTFDEGKVTIINNGIYIDKFRYNATYRSQIQTQYELAGKFVVGHVGRFVTQKNHSFLLDIFYEIQKITPNSVLLLVGDGPLLDSTTEKALRLGIYDKVCFAGVHKHVFWYYNAMDCFLLPSLYEGLPVVGVEAQINGVPCFFSHNVTNEIAINDNSHIVPAEYDAKQWASFVVNNYKKASLERADYALTFKNTKYDIVNESKRLLDLYESLLGVND